MSTSYRPSMEGIKHLDHTADLWLEAEGKSPDEMISRMIEGIYGVISSEFGLKGRGKRERIVVRSTEMETALIDILNEVLFIFDAEDGVMIERNITLKEVNGEVEIDIECEIFEAIVPSGMAGMEVKAVTHHDASVTRKDDRIIGRVLLDL